MAGDPTRATVMTLQDLAGTASRSDVLLILPPALSLTPPSFPDALPEALRGYHQAGAFAIAEAGLATGRRMTTHWQHRASFAARFPCVDLDVDWLLVDEGDILSAAGIMAWTNLALHLIENLHGRPIMLEVARAFVVDPKGREPQSFRPFRPSYAHGDTAIADVQKALQAAPGRDWTVMALADRAAMSDRSFLRRFRAATGLTPTAYLRRLRVARARALLETTRDAVDQVAFAVGYDDAGGFRRAFREIVALSPTEYRHRFGPQRHTDA